MADLRTTVLRALGDRPVTWLSQASGVSNATLAQWLAGDRSQGISSSHIDRLLHALRLEVAPRRPRRAARGYLFPLLCLAAAITFGCILLILAAAW